MFNKILIANRGEIALRIIRAAKEEGIKTVAVYSEIDADSLHVRFADEEVCIGPAMASESYLNIPQVISAALITGATAIHPGCGFLAENARFAEICNDHLIKFIGPPPEIIRQMGNKLDARKIAKQIGVVVLPSSDGIITSLEEAKKLSNKIGYPVIIKAVGGGGGKGMKMVTGESHLESNLNVARLEAKSAFGNPDVYIEKYISEPRHIEVQILADDYGNIIHLGERECSIQHRYQKLLEEAPSPQTNNRLRQQILEAAIKIAKAVKYKNVGTIEFLLNKTGKFYFIEMNPRLQVEHPVTEMTTGVDIVKEQIRLAAGERLNIKSNLKPTGHAIECRINAVDPKNEFFPSSGKILNLNIPGGIGIRVDTHIYPEYIVPTNYDSLVAKLIAYGNTRYEAIGRMKRALEEFVIEGIKTTIPFHQEILNDENFKKGESHTHFLSYMLNKK